MLFVAFSRFYVNSHTHENPVGKFIILTVLPVNDAKHYYTTPSV